MNSNVNTTRIFTIVKIAMVFAAALLTLLILSGTAFGKQFEEYSGTTRYETAAMQVLEAFPTGVAKGTAVLVCGQDNGWPDALSASSLAGAVDGPVLITETNTLSSFTLNAINTLGITDIIIVGGASVVSTEIEQQLEDMDITTTRLSGDNRYDTQDAVYRYGAERDWWNDTALVASGANFADCLSVSPVAYSQCMPVILCGNDGTFTAKQVESLYSGDITSVVLLGSEASVSLRVEGFMQSVTQYNNYLQGEDAAGNVIRVSGANRYETSANIANWAIRNGYLSWDKVAIASGTSVADSLSGGTLQGVTKAPLLLVGGVNDATIDAMAIYKDNIETVRVFGGTSVVSTEVRQAAANAVGIIYGHDDMTIMGDSSVTVAQMVVEFNAHNSSYPSYVYTQYGASNIWEFCQILYEEATSYGVRAEVLFAQAMWETGWLKFGGDVQPNQCNFGGIGATGGVPGNSFSSVREGLRAQTQHLHAYATYIDLPAAEVVDPRYGSWLHGRATTVQGLSGTWAVPGYDASTGITYGDNLMRLIRQTQSL